MTRAASLSTLGVALSLTLSGCASSTTAGAPQSRTPATSSPASQLTTRIATSSAAPASSSSAAESSSSALRTATAREACALVTEQEVTAALGKDPGPGSRFAAHGSTQCQYGSYQTAMLLVNVTPVLGRAGYDNIRNQRRPGASVTVADITGIGDRAFEVSARNTAGIFFNKGDAVVAVSLTIRTAATPPTAQAVALAKLAASRL